MIADDINDLWDARPFCPFEIAMANGETYTVTSPKLILLSPSRLHLVTPGDRLHILALNQINRVTVMEGGHPTTSAAVERQ
ncbi:MAG TPA: hypothetical protein DDZ88_02970 [Verrucomicrobiales bacterium]|nr:hypothetical protein [Verrucomicrobiales bacterium]